MGYTRRHLSKHDTDRQTYMEEYDLSPDKLIAKDFRVIRSSLPGFYPHGIGRTASYGKYWSHPPESNRRPTDYESEPKGKAREKVAESAQISSFLVSTQR